MLTAGPAFAKPSSIGSGCKNTLPHDFKNSIYRVNQMYQAQDCRLLLLKRKLSTSLIGEFGDFIEQSEFGVGVLRDPWFFFGMFPSELIPRLTRTIIKLKTIPCSLDVRDRTKTICLMKLTIREVIYICAGHIMSDGGATPRQKTKIDPQNQALRIDRWSSSHMPP